ncbi:MAG: hypothetical protein ACC726_09180, partial [Chloroflexota bacterium]
MPEASLTTWSGVATRIVVALFAMALVFTTFAASASPVAGADLAHQISSARSGQLYYGSRMRDQDRVIKQILRNRKTAKRGLKRAVNAL